VTDMTASVSSREKLFFIHRGYSTTVVADAVSCIYKKFKLQCTSMMYSQGGNIFIQ